MSEITYEELVRDIELTEKEVEAYRLLAKGYSLLCELPEYDVQDARINALKVDYYETASKECDAFLQKLKLMEENWSE